jgi:hypothetical protein
MFLFSDQFVIVRQFDKGREISQQPFRLVSQPASKWQGLEVGCLKECPVVIRLVGAWNPIEVFLAYFRGNLRNLANAFIDLARIRCVRLSSCFDPSFDGVGNTI